MHGKRKPLAAVDGEINEASPRKRSKNNCNGSLHQKRIEHFFPVSSQTNSSSIDPPILSTENNKNYLKSPHQRLNSLENSILSQTSSLLAAPTESVQESPEDNISENCSSAKNTKIGCKDFKDSQRVVAARHKAIYGSDIAQWKISFPLVCNAENTEPLHPWFENAFNAYVNKDSGDEYDLSSNERVFQNDEESWLKILALLNNSLSPKNHLSFTSLHKLLVSGVSHVSSPLVRSSSAHLFRKIINFLSVPDSKKVRSYYLKALAREEKGVEEFDDMESWELLEFLLESIFTGCERYILLFEVFIELMEIDFDLWYKFNEKRVTVADGIKAPPLIYKVLRFSSEPCLNLYAQKVIQNYVAAISDKVPKTVISSLRILISILAQIIGCRNNESKFEFVHFFATVIKEQDSLLHSSKKVLIMELYLMKPTWLSFSLSHSLIIHLTNLPHQRGQTVSLRSALESYIQSISSAERIDPKLHSNTLLTPRKGNSIRKTNISVDKRNAYGETPLHIACKRGNLERVHAILNCPKVDVNAKDHNGWTPLHEACSNNMVGCVKALMDFKPVDILSFLAKGSKSSKRVDLLSVAGDYAVNPFHDSVMADNVEVVSTIIDKIKSDSEFPSIELLINSTTGTGQNCMDLASSEEMKGILLDFNKGVSLPRKMYVDNTQFKIISYLITNFLSKYISYFGLHVQKEYLHFIARKNVKKGYARLSKWKSPPFFEHKSKSGIALVHCTFQRSKETAVRDIRSFCSLHTAQYSCPEVKKIIQILK